MHRICISFLFFWMYVIPCLHAQDTIWAQREGKDFKIRVRAKNGDNVNSMATRFGAPIALLASMNNVDFKAIFKAGQTVWIPFNKVNIKRSAGKEDRLVAYSISGNDKLADLAKILGISQAIIMQWNHLTDAGLKPGQRLVIGWLSINTATPSTTPLQADPVPSTSLADSVNNNDSAVLNPTERFIDSVKGLMEFNYQLQSEHVQTIEESGAVVFYDHKDARPGLYFAFHDKATNGTVLLVSNPSNGRKIYAKVIGRIPGLPEYKNSVVVLTGNAASALGVRYKRAFCKLRYH